MTAQTTAPGASVAAQAALTAPLPPTPAQIEAGAKVICLYFVQPVVEHADVACEVWTAMVNAQ